MRRPTTLAFTAAAAVLLLALPAGAYHFYNSGWRDKHYSYPPIPSGYNGIVSVFGQPCNGYANDNYTSWVASDNGVAYPVYYHYKLGGWGPYYGGDVSPGPSSNLNNDVRGHIRNNHLTGYVKQGIWGYNCRRISGSTKWSAHAWGIAVDINSKYEPPGDSKCDSIPSSLSDVWKSHGWKHGASFGDCMHFQYAINY